jgi:RNA polymerase sigma-70 factor (ECF subfamily)
MDGADAGLEVRDAIDHLDPKIAKVVRLVHWEGFTLAQTAAILDMPASTVRNHYQQAKQQLRAALDTGPEIAAQLRLDRTWPVP